MMGTRPAAACPKRCDAVASAVGALAIRSLGDELFLYPKPGLVSLHDSGAHRDMNACTFLRSIDALRPAFAALAAAGARNAVFEELRRIGIEAERWMMTATGGVNTHRGAIFTLGLLAAAAGSVFAAGLEPGDAALRDALVRWRRALLARPIDPAAEPSHGRTVAARYGAGGACAEAAAGFPSVFEIGLPALRDAMSRTGDFRRAALHALFALLATVKDTNVLHRGGREALRFLSGEASALLRAGSVLAHGGLERAEHLHRRCCEKGISPGGCADLLAATCFVHRLQTDR